MEEKFTSVVNGQRTSVIRQTVRTLDMFRRGGRDRQKESNFIGLTAPMSNFTMTTKKLTQSLKRFLSNTGVSSRVLLHAFYSEILFWKQVNLCEPVSWREVLWSDETKPDAVCQKPAIHGKTCFPPERGCTVLISM